MRVSACRGPSGVGKTHLAIAIGYEAVRAGIKVRFKNDGHYFCGAGGNRPDGSDEALTVKKWCGWQSTLRPRNGRCR
ncbi:TPA: hypothetical protein GFY14_17525 [Escherichia coli]|nr:hypothetical protein [Escherichia coli]